MAATAGMVADRENNTTNKKHCGKQIKSANQQNSKSNQQTSSMIDLTNTRLCYQRMIGWTETRLFDQRMIDWAETRLCYLQATASAADF